LKGATVTVSLEQLEALEVLDVPVTCLRSYDDTIAYVVTQIETRRPVFCVAINPWKIHLAKRDKTFREIIERATLHLCDGIGAAVAVRLLHGQSIPRITGIQLFFELIAVAEKHGYGVFLLGASPEVNAKARDELQAQHPGLNVVGRQHGYFTDDLEVVERINAAGPDMLFVAMGSPKQERWIAEHRVRLQVPLAMGVGGTFDVVSGHAARAPAFFRQTGTEFVYRVWRQPRRLREFYVIPDFIFSVLGACVHSLLSHRRAAGEPPK
jgi:N-acetylglucosaminyldiphosphoundecaprenol N-acetyl-beta-D-mannosaminyltransferase